MQQSLLQLKNNLSLNILSTIPRTTEFPNFPFVCPSNCGWQYKFKGSFEGWMRRITVNTVMQKYRAQDVYDIVNENAIEAVEVEVDEEGLSMDVLLNLEQKN